MLLEALKQRKKEPQATSGNRARQAQKSSPKVRQPLAVQLPPVQLPHRTLQERGAGGQQL